MSYEWQLEIYRHFRSGTYPASKPQILGVEAEGTIIAIASSGETYGLKAGDRVVWLGTGGAYAEYSTCSATKIFVLPQGLKPGVAAATLAQGLTALIFIQQAVHIEKGDWVLVQAAAGGVGLWLCKLLNAIGARVIGTVSTLEKMKLARENGAHFMIDYTREDVVTRVMEITRDTGVDSVFDSVGASTFDMDFELLARNGSLVSYGTSSGAVPLFSIARLSAKNIKLMKPSVFGYIETRDEFQSSTKELFDLIVKHNLHPIVHEVHPLEEIAKAHRDLELRKTSGKILLKP
jgi:NADPH:quinone reductase